MIGRRGAVLAALLLALGAGVYLRVRHSIATARYSADDGTGYFRAESALQYRYARLLAQGEAVPEVDRGLQHPEGVRTRAELTLLMERATAWTWFALPLKPRGDFHRFVVLWVAVVSSLSIPALYLLGLRLTRSAPAALGAALAYGASWAAVSSVSGSYGFQAFALPLIHWCLALSAGALDPASTGRVWRTAGAGLALMAALASWHFTRFFFASLVLAFAWAAWQARSERGELGRLRQTFTVLVAFAVLSGVLVGHLRESRFIISPAMALAYGLAFALHYPSRAKWAAAATLGAVGLMMINIPDGGAYGHVYGLLIEKLRHGLRKPVDPAELGWHARLLWNGAFDSPDPSALVFTALPLVLLLAPRLLRKDPEPAPSAGRLVDALALLYLGGAALAARLMPFAASFLCLAALRGLKPGRAAVWVGVVAGLELLKCLAPSSPLNLAMRASAKLAAPERAPSASWAHERELLRWLAVNAEGVPVVAGYGLSASLAAYAGTPVVLHPKFETAAIRVKVAAFLSALYSDEESLFSFCRKNEAGLLVYSVDSILDDTQDGPRYASGSMRLTTASPAYLLHFKPETLKRFELVYQNPEFRVYSVGGAGKAKPPYLPVYDLSLYKPRLEGERLWLDTASVNERIRQARQRLTLARLLARVGQTERALAAYRDSFELWPPDPSMTEEARRLAESLPR